MIEEIGISRKLNSNEVREIASKIFKGLIFVELDLIQTDSTKIGNHLNSESEIIFEIIENQSEFPTRIEFYFKDQEYANKREMYLAKMISKLLNCRTIVAYENPVDKDNPFSNLVFDNNSIFLACDSKSKYSENGEQEVEIIKELRIEINDNFDNFGKYIGIPKR